MVKKVEEININQPNLLRLDLQHFAGANTETSISDLEKRLQDIENREKEISDILSNRDKEVDLESINNELDNLDQESRRLENLKLKAEAREIAREINDGTRSYRTISSFSSLAGVNTESTSKKTNDTKEYRSAFWNTIRSNGSALRDPREHEILNQPEVRALSIATNQAGGVLVPAYWEQTLVQKLTEANVMRQLGNTLPLQAGDRKIPIVTDYGQASWLDEGQAFPESDVAFDQILLGGFKIGRIIQVSEELMHDSIIDLDTMIADSFVKSFASLEEDAFINGNGMDRPTGILGRATVGKTGTDIDSILADELFDLFYSLKRPYRPTASWLMNDQTVKVVRQLKTADGQYIWSPGLGTEPPTLLGRPVFTSEAMPTMAAGAKSILFGDFSYYKIADREGRVMQRLNERYADVGRVGIRMYQRVDGNLSLPEAVKVFQNPEV